ncbi:DUF3572 family protein [Paenirhodobacter sp.]|uniref:DUF3572 family protein n=1 Tax=Paenirhodobacter sp. TaxID=1965326 RepID=UPI003B3F70AC
MNEEDARILALGALAWLAGEDEVFAAFLGASGATAADVRAQADQPAFLLSVLDFVMQTDEWVLACAGACGVRPERIGTARAVMGGRDRMHWT